MKTPAQTCAFDNLWKWLQARAFFKMQARTCFKILRCWMTTTGTNFLYK